MLISKHHAGAWGIFALILCANILLWFSVRGMQARWTNVPPVPSAQSARFFGLGDAQLSYRLIGMMLQYIGDSGGRVTPLGSYDYDALGRWFFLEDELDPQSDFIPFLAAYYFGGIADPDKLRPVIAYLRAVGRSTAGEKWRWLAQAVFLAKYYVKDMDLALEMAHELAGLDRADLPVWARAMPVFILKDIGRKEAAYMIMLETLKTGAESLHPNEINFMRDYICKNLLPEEAAQTHPLCQDIPE